MARRDDDDDGTTRGTPTTPTAVSGSGAMIQAVPDPRPEPPEEEEAVERAAPPEEEADAEAAATSTPSAGDADEPDGDPPPAPDFVARTLHLPRRLARRLDGVARELEREPSEIVAATLDACLDRLVDGSDTGDSPGSDSGRPTLHVLPASDGAPPGTAQAQQPVADPRDPARGVPASSNGDPVPANGNGHPTSSDTAAAAGGSEAMAACLETLRCTARSPLDAAVVRDAATRILRRLDRWQPDALEHAEAVARLASRLGAELDLDGLDVETAELAGLLHDIGKLEVPVEVLQKRGALTSKEWQLVRGYPEWGARALEQLEGFAPLVPLVRYHKETWDGSGYPHGLEGDDIPLGAQVIGIADAFHTMLSPRPYRPALSLEQARACIRDNVGTFWAPPVAEALLALAADTQRSV